jgi:hypothetical protein
MDYSKCDSCVKTVIEKFIIRSEFGLKKYGTNLDRDDLDLLEWINHSQEELMDGILYLEKIKKEYTKKLSLLENICKEDTGKCDN